MGAKDALQGQLNAVVHMEVGVKITRRYVWLFKLRYIWTIIRVKVI